MGKIYCTECGAELDDSMNFCSNCGEKLDKEDITDDSNEIIETKDNSNEVEDNSSNNDSVKINETSKKSNNSKYSTTTKVFLGISAVCIIIFIIGVVLIGSALMNTADNVDVSEDAPKTLSPSFKDTIYGIDFQIPEGFETFDGTDNQNIGTSTTYDRSYIGPDAGLIKISVSTTKGNFYWDLSQNRAYDDVDKTINGHDGILDAGGGFKYVTGDKLVMINGATEDQLESIIIE